MLQGPQALLSTLHVLAGQLQLRLQPCAFLLALCLARLPWSAVRGTQGVFWALG